MAMLRVSSYRKLFEQEQWGRNGGSSVQCAGQYQAASRGATAHECHCETPDFAASTLLNKQGLSRYAQERTIIAALNDRLAKLIEMARCFEEENESLECQIMELEDRQNDQQASSSSTTIAVPNYSLEAVVERLRKERDDILCDSEELKRELECLHQEHEKVVEQRTFLQLERQDVAEAVDVVTSECLALRDQVAIYEEQLANMETLHNTRIEGLEGPVDGMAGAVAAVEFCSPDITPALDIKQYYCQLAESLQYECGVLSTVGVAAASGTQLEVAGAAGAEVKDASGITDPNELKKLIAVLEKELAELENCGEELEDEIENRRAAYSEEIAELECRVEEMRQQQDDMKAQLREHCGDYRELLSEKMARDIEIAAYRGLVEEEEDRLCYV